MHPPRYSPVRHGNYRPQPASQQKIAKKARETAQLKGDTLNKRRQQTKQRIHPGALHHNKLHAAAFNLYGTTVCTDAAATAAASPRVTATTAEPATIAAANINHLMKGSVCMRRGDLEKKGLEIVPCLLL